jgi:hypothetical protein
LYGLSVSLALYKGRLYACFVDFQKAFDTVIHCGIKLKLLEIGVGTLFYNVIKKYVYIEA